MAEAKQRIDQEQCDEMTERAGQLLERARAAEARAATLTEALERIVDWTTYWDVAWVERIARDALAETDEGAE